MRRILELDGWPRSGRAASMKLMIGAGLLASLLTQAAPSLQSVTGPLGPVASGFILPHEHIFTDLRGPEAPGYGQADPAEVVRTMKPLLLEAKGAGVTTLIECTTIGVGRNVPVLARLARETGLNIVLPTGVYGRGNFAPKDYAERTEDDLARWMMSELVVGIEGTGVRAGFIKTAASDDELKPLEEKFLRASARASLQTGAAIASHTVSGKVAERQANILESLGVALSRFVWVHAQAEKNSDFHVGLARRGVWIELDSVGASDAEDLRIIGLIRALHAAGLAQRILISQDAGWFDPGQPEGGKKRGYTALPKSFLPKLLEANFEEDLIRRLTRENPFRAFALEPPPKP